MIGIEPNSSGYITVLTKIKKPINIEPKLTIIQKFLRGYKSYKQINELRAKANVIKSRNSKETSSGDTLERATNQNDLLSLMCMKKEETKQEVVTNTNLQQDFDQTNNIKPNKLGMSEVKATKPLQKKHKGRNIAIKNDQMSKSYSNIEKDLK